MNCVSFGLVVLQLYKINVIYNCKTIIFNTFFNCKTLYLVASLIAIYILCTVYLGTLSLGPIMILKSLCIIMKVL